MFDDVARRYDLTNTVLSFGQDRYWRAVSRRALAPRPGERILDLAAGTGVSTAAFSRTGAWCVAADFSVGMLSAGRWREVPMVAAYVYLAESIRAWPDQRALAGKIADAGWSGVAWRDLTGGVVAVHRAVKPPA